jgi:ribonuclease P protein component
MDQRLPKTERLSSKKDIAFLFQKGNSLFSHPYRIVWLKNEEPTRAVDVQILISVSKRYFKRAVDRNQIKRYIKEAYRTQKPALLDNLPQADDAQYHVAIMYIDKEIRDFQFHQKAIQKLLGKLSKEISNN